MPPLYAVWVLLVVKGLDVCSDLQQVTLRVIDRLERVTGVVDALLLLVVDRLVTVLGGEVVLHRQDPHIGLADGDVLWQTPQLGTQWPLWTEVTVVTPR